MGLPPGAHAGESDPGSASIDVAAAWAVARPRVAAAVAARGAQPADADDVVQEVALRALAGDRQFQSEEHFVRWCCRVAINLRIDDARRARHLAPPLSTEAAGVHDTAREAERRMALDRLATSIAALTPEDRRLLFDGTPADTRREAVRLAVRRHRLRARLAATVEGLAGAFGFMRRAARRMPASAKLAAVAVPCLVGELAIGPLLMPPRAGPMHAPKGPGRAVAVVLGSAESPRGGASAVASSARRSNRAPTVAPARATQPLPLSSSRPIAEVKGPAHVVVTQQTRPDDHITVCTVGSVQVCVDHPRPAPLPTPNPLL